MPSSSAPAARQAAGHRCAFSSRRGRRSARCCPVAELRHAGTPRRAALTRPGRPPRRLRTQPRRACPAARWAREAGSLASSLSDGLRSRLMAGWKLRRCEGNGRRRRRDGKTWGSATLPVRVRDPETIRLQPPNVGLLRLVLQRILPAGAEPLHRCWSVGAQPACGALSGEPPAEGDPVAAEEDVRKNRVPADERTQDSRVGDATASSRARADRT